MKYSFSSSRIYFGNVLFHLTGAMVGLIVSATTEKANKAVEIKAEEEEEEEEEEETKRL